MFHLIGFIVFGFIVGLIARALTPGRQHMGIAITSLLGIAGSVVAGWIGQLFGWYGPDDSSGFLMSIGGAVLLLFIYHKVAGRSSPTSSSQDRNYPRRVA